MAYLIVGFFALVFLMAIGDIVFDGLGIDLFGLGDHIPNCETIREHDGRYATCGDEMIGFGVDNWGLSASYPD